jgi:hypothetical protein
MTQTFEGILRDLRKSCITAGAQVIGDGVVRVWIGDQIIGVKASTIIASDNLSQGTNWLGASRAIRWLHDAAVRLYPDSPYTRSHSAR